MVTTPVVLGPAGPYYPDLHPAAKGSQLPPLFQPHPFPDARTLVTRPNPGKPPSPWMPHRVPPSTPPNTSHPLGCEACWVSACSLTFGSGCSQRHSDLHPLCRVCADSSRNQDLPLSTSRSLRAAHSSWVSHLCHSSFPTPGTPQTPCDYGLKLHLPARAQKAQPRQGQEGTAGALSRIKGSRCQGPSTRGKEATGIIHSLKHTIKLQTWSCCQKSPGGTRVNPFRDQGCLPLLPSTQQDCSTACRTPAQHSRGM